MVGVHHHRDAICFCQPMYMFCAADRSKDGCALTVIAQALTRIKCRASVTKLDDYR